MFGYIGMTLDNLAEQLESLDNALQDVDEDLFLRLSGCTTCAGIELYYPVWDTESDDREWDEDRNGYKITVQEYVLQRLERLSASLIVAVDRVKRDMPTSDGAE